MYKELLLELISNWNEEQLDLYIIEMEQRQMELNQVIKQLKEIRRKRTKKQTPENGPRDGR